MICMWTPAGQEEFFMAVGDPVTGRTAPPPDLSQEEKADRGGRAQALTARYRTEMVKP
jgi:hypothetical protein